MSAPAFSFLASALGFVEAHAHWFLLAWFVGVFALERVCRAFPPKPAAAGGRVRRWLTGIAFGVLNHSVLSSLLVVPLLVWACGVSWWAWPAWVPSGLLIALTILALDLAGYAFHRASHASDWLWRFHQVHHLDEDMDATTGLRVHGAEKLMAAAVAAGVIVALHLPWAGVAVHAAAAFACATFHHSNVRLPGWLERVLAPFLITPAFHYPHHHEQKQDTNSNYGFIFPWWDRLFGTYNPRRRTAAWRMGLDYSPDLTCAGLLCEPFRPTPLWERAKAPAAAGEKSAARAEEDALASAAS